MALLDNDYTIDLLCNLYLVEDIKKVKVTLMIQSNDEEFSVNNKTKISGYNKRVWFSRRDITNIIGLKNLT